MARKIALNPQATIVDVHRAKLRLSLETMADASRQGWAKVRLQRRELELRAPPLPTAQEEQGAQSVPLHRLSPEDFARYRALAERMRADFAAMAPAEVAELQALLRKAREAAGPATPTAQHAGGEHGADTRGEGQAESEAVPGDAQPGQLQPPPTR